MLEYQLIRSKRRKTLSLQVKYGQVTVRAPHYVSSTFIDTFIKEKSAWLRAKVIEQQGEVKFCDFNQGASLLCLGEQVTLNIYLAKQAKVFIDNRTVSQIESLITQLNFQQNSQQDSQQSELRLLNVVISERVNARLTNPLARAKQVKKQLESYFKLQAEQLIIERLGLISLKTSLIPKRVSIRQYRARWGSCNNRGELSFNYLLMMTPQFVIDYVIVHELCHLEHLNHSKDFWQLVEKHLPNYQVAKRWLNEHQSQLHWQTPA